MESEIRVPDFKNFTIDIDLSWFPVVIEEAKKRGKKKGKNGRPSIDKEYLFAETDRRLSEHKKPEAV